MKARLQTHILMSIQSQLPALINNIHMMPVLVNRVNKKPSSRCVSRILFWDVFRALMPLYWLMVKQAPERPGQWVQDRLLASANKTTVLFQELSKPYSTRLKNEGAESNLSSSVVSWKFTTKSSMIYQMATLCMCLVKEKRKFIFVRRRMAPYL